MRVDVRRPRLRPWRGGCCGRVTPARARPFRLGRRSGLSHSRRARPPLSRSSLVTRTAPSLVRSDCHASVPREPCYNKKRQLSHQNPSSHAPLSASRCTPSRSLRHRDSTTHRSYDELRLRKNLRGGKCRLYQRSTHCLRNGLLSARGLTLNKRVRGRTASASTAPRSPPRSPASGST